MIDQVEIDPLIARFKGGGTSSYHPRMLLKVVVFSYLGNIYSSRRMEAALKENIHFMWISGMNTPDHNTIKTSRERIRKQLEELWTFTLQVAKQELADTSPTTFAKIDAAKVTETIEAINEAPKDKPVSKKIRQKIKHASKNWPGNLQKYDRQEEVLQGRNSYSKTDPDATFIRMKEDHMMNGQLKPGYNWQISTSNQFILQYSIHQTATDYNTLPSHLGEFEDIYGFMPLVATADAGCGSEENYKFPEENKIKAFVKDNYFDKDQSGKPYRDGFNQTKLHYNEELDRFYFPMGQPMKRIGCRKKITTNGYEQLYSAYEATNCHGCPQRGMCNKQKGNRRIDVNHRLRAYIEKARANLTSEEGISHRKKKTR